jgi:hypothetical protein
VKAVVSTLANALQKVLEGPGAGALDRETIRAHGRRYQSNEVVRRLVDVCREILDAENGRAGRVSGGNTP